MRLLDLFAGKLGWARVFAARGWKCVCVDLVEPPEIPEGCVFIHADVLSIRKFELPKLSRFGGPFDFICASSPCEEFAKFGLKMFHPNAPYPANGIRLFNHTREVCELSGIPYVMENVRGAQDFVGKAVTHCGPFYLWGTGVPKTVQHGLFGENSHIPDPMPRGITKGMSIGSGGRIKGMSQEEKRLYRKQFPALQCSGTGNKRKAMTADWATIPRN